MVGAMRYKSLDVLRGIAILGTLGTNIWLFTSPEGFIGYLEQVDQPSGAWLWAEKVLQALAQGKFLGLLTIMFGIGLAIQQRSAVKRGLPWPGPYPWRALLLFVDGVVHFVLVVEFDVLMGYAVTGLVVAYLLVTSERAQRRWMIATASVHVALLSLITVAILAAPAAEPGTAAQFNPYADGSWWDLVVFRLENALVFRLEPILIFAMSIALFLAGAKLFQAGVLGPQGAAIRRRLLIVGAVAFPIDFTLNVFGGAAGVVAGRYGTAPFVSLGILGAVATFYAHRDQLGLVGARLSDVGRMALSCYVLQNILASVLCYGWGLGLAAQVGAQARVPFTVAVYLVVTAGILLFARLWLSRFERGPVEWLWNSSYRAITTRRDQVPALTGKG